VWEGIPRGSGVSSDVLSPADDAKSRNKS